MNSYRSGLPPFLFALSIFFLLASSATAGPYVYGISDDNNVHQVDLTGFTDGVIFNTGLTGLTNGVAWDEAAGRLYYRSPDDGKLYLWTRATNTQQMFYGMALPGFNSNAAIYNGDYWFVQDGTDTLVRASLFLGVPNLPVVNWADTFANFDGTGFTNFLFGDITIDKNGILYGSSNYGLFSVNISGPQPSGFKIISGSFGVRQIAVDSTGSFIYTQDYTTGKWYQTDLNGVESPLLGPGGVQFTSTSLRDLSDVTPGPRTIDPPTVADVPEPAAWQFLALGTLGIAFLQLRRRRAIAAASSSYR
jgi:hypothetical protein